jgi:hypothetical protein
MRPLETSTREYGNVELTINIYPDDTGCIDDYVCGDDITVAYLRDTRYVLGTKAVTQDEMDRIAEDIESGKLIGLPVYAYIHSGIALSTGKFSCPWDSGQSGFVYMKAEDAPSYGEPEAALRSMVETVGQILNGEVYGYEIVDEQGEHVDSCWGFVGFDDVNAEANRSAEYYAKQLSDERRAEAVERAAWAARGVVTA